MSNAEGREDLIEVIGLYDAVQKRYNDLYEFGRPFPPMHSGETFYDSLDKAKWGIENLAHDVHRVENGVSTGNAHIEIEFFLDNLLFVDRRIAFCEKELQVIRGRETARVR